MARADLGRWMAAMVAVAALGGCGANYAANSDLPPAPTGGATGGGGSSAASGSSSGSSTSAASCGTDTWNNYAAAFFANSCESCHQHTTEFSSESAVLAKAGIIESYVNQGLMPQGAPLPQADRDRLAAWFSCPDGTPVTSTTGGSSSTSSTSGATTSTSGSSGTTGTCSTYTWADVQGIFANYCVSCHNPSGTAAAYVDLSSQSAATADASNIYTYVNAGLMPQAGSPQLSAADKSTVLGWASNPSGQCSTSSSGSSGSGGTTGSTNPAGSLGAISACVSWTWGSAPSQPEGSNMNPGDNCMQCHQPNGSANGSDKLWDFAGTVYTDAAGTAGVQYATITVVDVSGAVATAQSHSSGNFYHLPPWGGSPVQQPLSITITKGSDTQWMLHSAPNGACNSCHTASGQCTAPGRIHIP